jgi:hypothetical protein
MRDPGEADDCWADRKGSIMNVSQKPTLIAARNLGGFGLALAMCLLNAGTRPASASPSLCDATPGNLITNCGFESGPVSQASLGFTSGYSYTANLVPAGTFYIGSNPNTFNGFFAGFQNGSSLPLPNSGSQQMIINGASSRVTVWSEQSIAVMPNTNYFFSAFVQSVTDISPPVLDFSANGVQLGNAFTSSTTTGVEQEFVASWFSASATTVDLSLVDSNTASGGNDFALDDFIFSTTAPTGATGVGGTGTGTVGVPEPSSLLVLALGLLSLLGRRHFAKRSAPNARSRTTLSEKPPVVFASDQDALPEAAVA